MKENENSPGRLLDKAEEYGKSGIELLKLKALDKSSDVISSVIPHSVVFLLISTFLIFLNLGVAFGLGEALGKPYFGFLIVAAFYGSFALILHFFMHDWIKKIIRTYLIKLIIKII